MQTHQLDVAGARLFVLEDGQGRALVFLHGGMANHLAGVPFVKPLTTRWRVILPDQRGSGQSFFGGPLTFERLADDVAGILDALRIERAIVGGASGGTGVAVAFALRHSQRMDALVLVKPFYAGAERGYTDEQRASMTGMDAVASRALTEGVQVLRPLYANLPEPIRVGALKMIEGWDPASVVTTSRFLASGAQPFERAADLARIKVPTLLVRGDDGMHPASISDLYAQHLPDCRVLPADTADVSSAIGAFCDGLALAP